MKSYDRLFIGGEWVSPAGTGTIDVINPTTEEVVGRVPDATDGRRRQGRGAGTRRLRQRPVAPHDAGRAGRRS